MKLRGQLRTAAVSHFLVEWRRCALAPFRRSAYPNTTSLHQGMRLTGACSIGRRKSEERAFADYSRCMR